LKSRIFVVLSLITILLGLRGATASRSASLAAGNSPALAYLPVVFGRALDLTVTNLEVTQSVQRADNSVPLVAGRSTVLRVFARTLVGTPPNNVIVTLAAWRGGAPLGTISLGPGLVPPSPSRADYNSSRNFLLPASWLSGTVVVVATVDASAVVAESNESNNSLQVTLNFNQVPPLDIKIVPVDYIHQGSVNPGTYPGQEDSRIKEWIQRAYPVNSVVTSFGSPHLGFQGNLEVGSEWSELLYAVTDRKFFDAAPASQVYYGLIPIRNGSTQWFFSGIAGIGWIGSRTSVGLNLPSLNGTGKLAAHEVGHNLGRYHAPCGVSTQAYYPYSGGIIGEYGLDINGSSISLLSPSAYLDVMSYCSPEWISDYTYVGLYTDQLANGLAAATSADPQLMIRVRFDPDGVPQLMPVYVVSRGPAAQAAGGEYTISLLDADGATLSSHNTSLVEAGEEGVDVRAIYAAIPLPAAPVAAIQLAGPVGLSARRELTSIASRPAGTASLTRSGRTMSLAWDRPETPVLVRFLSDDGRTVSTLGVDILGGILSVATDTLPVVPGRFEIIPADSPPQAAISAALELP
jgi:hypothetical protein